MMNRPFCVYCGTPDPLTMDHSPPRSLFPEKLPTDTRMVTAPACQPCHDANMKDDTTVRNILISTQESERHPAVIHTLAGKRNRSLERSVERSGADLQGLLQTMTLVDVRTPAGIYIGKNWAFNFDSPVMNRFIERLSRALLWYEFQEPYFRGAFAWRINVELPAPVYEGIQRFGRLRNVHDVFAYGLTHLRDDSPSWIVANFYASIEFLISVTRTEQFRPTNPHGR